tara:strand:+ start:693 stop:1124 length:432 start_codon:yes stop_codon:yes gene_type:complete
MKVWILSVLSATIFFVIGQIYLKKSFKNTSDFNITAVIFGLLIGIMALLYIILLKYRHAPLKYDYDQIFNASIAGIMFFIGNLLWIYCISSKIQLGNIRTFMAGFEMFLLFSVGILLFKDSVKIIQIIGVLLTLLGIYCISYQ